ncbi:MAG TPA: tRNA (N(6)-L-threonylcarbamoyladenosine(37)-C(2))-methylthiotransferase MtaB, partial [Acidobacteriota bacterium]|nr:tRNA (N(6)-L-threonylcarbamoyladenosine(37)-C(2))-methylthiotransferase MtaB [Acidobacteriota bacterium]
YIATFGCRTNQADSAAIRESFLHSSIEETTQPGDADIIVLNTCTVTHRSDQQVRQLARKMRRENQGARIVVTGCYAQRDPGALADIKGVDAVIGNTHKGDLVQISESLPAGPRAGNDAHGEVPVYGEVPVFREDFLKNRTLELTPAEFVGGRTRPYVKIQDGCDAKCAYCIIPEVRGPSRSVRPDTILRQVQDLIDAGFAEIVLTGIHIGTYGLHAQPRYPLDRLLTDIAGLPGLGRLRLSSIEPMELSQRVIELAAATDRIAPHFHICLQSGSDRVLKRMLRPYNTEKFSRIVERIRELIPEAGIGTDVIVGFPGETAEDHEATFRFLEEGPFTYIHVFPYSDRPGTRASGFGEKVDSKLIKKRSQELRELSVRKNSEFRRRFLGQSLSVLTLTEKTNGMREAVAGNYLKAKLDGQLEGNRLLIGRAVREDGEYLVLESARNLSHR